MNANNQTAMTNEEAGGGADAGQEHKAAPVAPGGAANNGCDDRPNDSRRVEADKPGMTRNKSCAKARAYRRQIMKKKNTAAKAVNAATAKIPAHARRLLQEVEQQADDLLEAIWVDLNPDENPKLYMAKRCYDMRRFEAMMSAKDWQNSPAFLYYTGAHNIAEEIQAFSNCPEFEEVDTMPLAKALAKLGDSEFCKQRREAYFKPRPDHQRRGSRTKRQDGVRTKQCDAQAPRGPAVSGSKPKAD